MLETKELIETARREARDLDHLLIVGRTSVVRRNLEQIEERPRSEKYVGRLAGESTDIYRRSRTEAFVEWVGSTVLEDAPRAGMVGEFLRPLLSYPNQHTIFIAKSFWELDEEIAAMFAQVRRAVVDANQLEAKFHLVQAREKINEALRAIDGMPTF